MRAGKADRNPSADGRVLIAAGAQHRCGEGSDADDGQQRLPNDLVDEKPEFIESGPPTPHCAPTSTGSTCPGPTSASALAAFPWELIIAMCRSNGWALAR